MQRIDSLEKTLMLRKIEDRRRRGWQKMRWLDGITNSRWTWVWATSRIWWWTGKPGMLQSMVSHRAGHDWATELNWQLLYHTVSLLLCSKVHQSLFLSFPGSFRSRPAHIPCAIQQALISCLFYPYSCAFVNPSLPIHPIPLPPLETTTCSLCLWLCFWTQICSSVLFL